MWIRKASMGFVTVDKMNSVSFFHFDSLTCCHFIHMTNIDGFFKSKWFPIQTQIFNKKRVGEGGQFHLPPCRWSGKNQKAHPNLFSTWNNLSEYAQGDYNSSNEPPYKGLVWLFLQVWNSASLAFYDYSSQPSPPLLTPSPVPYRQAREGENYETGCWAHQLSHIESQTQGENNLLSCALCLEPHLLKDRRGLGPKTYWIPEQGGKPGDESSPGGYTPRTWWGRPGGL